LATLKDTAQYFGVSIQAMSDYINKHLQDLNVDGEHAAIHRGKWFIDDIAITRLEQLRGFNDGAGLPLTNSPATIDNFRSVISNLQNQINDLQLRFDSLESNFKALESKLESNRSWIDRVFK
jgi:hypothetical protein